MKISELVRQIKENFKKFRPFVQYEPVLDRLYIQTRDCSIVEHRINSMVTIFEDNYPKAGQAKYVGLALTGISFGMGLIMPLSSLALFLDKILNSLDPQIVEEWVNRVVESILCQQ